MAGLQEINSMYIRQVMFTFYMFIKELPAWILQNYESVSLFCYKLQTKIPLTL